MYNFLIIMFWNFNIDDTEKINTNKLNFQEFIKHNYPISLDQAKTAVNILSLYFQNGHKGIAKQKLWYNY